jgi:hypothetical protein
MGIVMGVSLLFESKACGEMGSGILWELVTVGGTAGLGGSLVSRAFVVWCINING